MLRAIKIRLYPTIKQKIELNKTLGSNRFVYNSCLSYKKEEYDNNENSINLQGLALHFNNLRDRLGYDFLKEQNTKVIRYTLMNLMTAYKNFFERPDVGFPKFKSKKNEERVTFPRQAVAKESIDDGRLNLTKRIRQIKFKCSKRDKLYLNNNQEEIKSVTITKTKSEKYFASVLIDGDLVRLPKQPNRDFVGVDVGIKMFCVLSDGQIQENPKWIRANEKQLKRLHKRVSRKQKGSNNRNKARKKLAIKHEKIKNKKDNFLHNLTNKIIDENQVIILESLSVKNMLKNHCLAKSIQELSLYEFRRQLEYKANWYGRHIVFLDKWFPSSKTCSACGWYNKDLTLKYHTFVCEDCGLVIDRDLNASINVENEGRRLFFEQNDTIGISSPDFTLVDSAMAGINVSNINIANTINGLTKSQKQKQEENLACK